MKHTVHYSLGHPAVWLLATWTVVFTAQARGAAPRPASSRYVEGELLVKFKGGPRGEAAGRVKSALQHAVQRDFEFIGWQRIQLPAGMTVETALARYQTLPEVLAVEPNYVTRFIEPVTTPAPAVGFQKREAKDAGGATPNDPIFGQEWGLAKIGVTNAWAITTGSTNVVVAMIDTGINYNHEDLRANMWRNPGEIPGNGIDDDGNGYVDDVYGWDAVDNQGDPMDEGYGSPRVYHGTACVGIIGAVGNNGIGIAGVNWSVQLMAVRNGSTNDINSIADSIESFQYVTLMRRRGVNIRATNSSYSTDPDTYSQALKDAIDAAGNEGILNVCAANNHASDIDVNRSYPASYTSPTIIAVAASDINDNLASFSNWGRTNVHLAAPGVAIRMPYGPATNAYTTDSGTSASAPFVTGAVALLAAANPNATAADIKAALLESVDVLPAFTNKMVSNGRLNAARALEVILGQVSNTPPVVRLPPPSQTVLAGTSAVLGMPVLGVLGTRPLKYQWVCNDLALVQATNASLTLSNVSPSSAGDYRVVVSNAFGVVTSELAVLTVVPLLITTQPRSQLVAGGNNVTFSVTVTSTVPVTCQWQANGTNLPNGTSLTLALTNVQPAQAGLYAAVVSNRFGSVTSDVATLTVAYRATFVQQPTSQTVAVGQTVFLTVGVDGTPPIAYRWRWNTNSTFVPFGVGTSTLTLFNVSLTNAGYYSAVVSNVVTSPRVSSYAYLTVVLPPTDQGAKAGTDVTLRAVVNGPVNGPSGTMRYQWQFQGTNLAGATSTNLVLTNVQPAQAGNYTFIVTNTAGTPAGFTASLTVLTEGDVFGITAVGRGLPVTVSLQSSTNRLYTLLSCTDLANPLWAPVPGATDLPGTGSTVTLQDTNRRPAAAIFYRVSVRSP